MGLRLGQHIKRLMLQKHKKAVMALKCLKRYDSANEDLFRFFCELSVHK